MKDILKEIKSNSWKNSLEEITMQERSIERWSTVKKLQKQAAFRPVSAVWTFDRDIKNTSHKPSGRKSTT